VSEKDEDWGEGLHRKHPAQESHRAKRQIKKCHTTRRRKSVEEKRDSRFPKETYGRDCRDGPSDREKGSQKRGGENQSFEKRARPPGRARKPASHSRLCDLATKRIRKIEDELESSENEPKERLGSKQDLVMGSGPWRSARGKEPPKRTKKEARVRSVRKRSIKKKVTLLPTLYFSVTTTVRERPNEKTITSMTLYKRGSGLASDRSRISKGGACATPLKTKQGRRVVVAA